MREQIEEIISKVHQKNIWDEEPVYCFTSDVDWASEAVMDNFFSQIDPLEIKPTLFVTHPSEIIQSYFNAGKIERGIHPNFLANSSHGNSFKEIVENCIQWAPESDSFRSHRAFDVTDITHLLQRDYGYKYMSNQITILQDFIRPIFHESRLINFPVFFEDGTHLYNELQFNLDSYQKYFTSPGIKIISFHPMNFVFNSPTMPFMRGLKDSLTREEYSNITSNTIKKLKNKDAGVGEMVLNIIQFVKRNNYKIMSLRELYHTLNL